MRKRAMAMLILFLLVAAIPAQGEKLPRTTLMRFYDDAVFVGDSVTKQLEIFVRRQRARQPGYLGKAQFLAEQNYSLYRGSRNSVAKKEVSFSYKGQPAPLCRILGEMRPKRALILLGLNDYIPTKISKGMTYIKRIVTLTKKYAPDTQVIFFSLTPVTKAFGGKKDYQPLWDEYNRALEKQCRGLNIPFIDIATALKDKTGHLDAAYTNDKKCHLSAKGLKCWVNTLLAHAQSQYDQGAWKPPQK